MSVLYDEDDDDDVQWPRPVCFVLFTQTWHLAKNVCWLYSDRPRTFHDWRVQQKMGILYSLYVHNTHTHSKHLSVSVSHLVGSNRSRFACLACAFINTLCLESAELGVRRPPIKTPFGQNNNWNKEWHIFFFSTRLFVCFGDFRLRIVPGAAEVRESKSVKSGCRYVLCWGGRVMSAFFGGGPCLMRHVHYYRHIPIDWLTDEEGRGTIRFSRHWAI